MANMMLREMQLSMMFPGFKFSPTDEELISFYLRKKIEGSDDSVQVISEIDLCQFEPWDLPERSVIPSNSEWFFFCARGKKYPNGLQSKRATECGYWKATGKERNVKSGSNVIGTKRTLVFHKGRAPKGERTEWIMHEYCISGNSQDTRVVCRLRKNSEFRIIGNPRRGSRNRSANNSLGEDDIDLTGLFDEDKALDGCNSSYNSHSVEPTDSGSESDQNITNDPLLHASSSHQSQQKDGEGEGEDDDCFAEIMNDDIIKLDESSLPTDSHFEGTIIKRRQAAPKVGLDDQIPTQGAANQRIRLLMKNMKTNLSCSNSSDGLEVGNNDDSINTHVETRSCMLVKWQFIDMVLVILGLLGLFFFCMGRDN